MDRNRGSRRFVVPALLLVIVLAAIGAAVGAVSAVLRGPSWASSAQLLWDPSVRAGIDPTYNAPDSQAFDRQVADQQDVVLSDSVVGRVARAIDEPAAQVRDQVTVTSTAGSAAFTIQATATTATQARAVARATTSAYIATLQARNETLLQSRVTALTAQATTLRRQSAASPGGALATSLADVQTQLSAAQAALQDVPVEASVQRAAAVPSSPASLGAAVQAIVGGGLGAVLAICVLLAVWTRGTRRQPVAEREEAVALQAVAPAPAAALLAPPQAPVVEQPAPAPAPPAPLRDPVVEHHAPDSLAHTASTEPLTVEERPYFEESTADPEPGLDSIGDAESEGVRAGGEHDLSTPAAAPSEAARG